MDENSATKFNNWKYRNFSEFNEFQQWFNIKWTREIFFQKLECYLNFEKKIFPNFKSLSLINFYLARRRTRGKKKKKKEKEEEL